ncbi:exo-beta-N-acetylmuramidase NamZ domain-containing protein [Sporosarcina cyprini]|uniref:exo-beta-N-acetylmuramidase NamZ family protein n=1 Tax=Sporosarcina cyprini TaxID=2910523 RepID=UPI001EDDEE28|nr:DUF1343 domain-containing protein [Sporosarcina cyprini]MCG3088121.1 DUF1343 domain-containing protein [Sporosarcina cyprini]
MMFVKLGIDVFLETQVEEVRGKRIGLLTNQTGVSASLDSTIRLFHEHPDIHLTALFAPEHGLLTNKKEGEKFGDSRHPKAGVPVFSLYGETKRPTDEMMEKVDVVVMDIQDIGARYYTYIYTMAYMMEACARKGKRMIVLDRPNPIGGTAVVGNRIAPDFTSFVGLYPIPNRHGMTIGELASYFNEAFAIKCPLTVVEMQGWKRDNLLPDLNLPWVPPSPNVTSLDMMLLYPGTCLLEGLNLSEGRGTTQPFEILGAPFIDGERLQDAVNELGLKHVKARSTVFTPTYQKYAGEMCQGIQLHVLDRRKIEPVRTMVQVLDVLFKLYPYDISFLEYGSLKHPMFDLLAGSSTLRNGLRIGDPVGYIEECVEGTKEFVADRERYLRYR